LGISGQAGTSLTWIPMLVFCDHLGFKDLFMELDTKSKKRESNVQFMAIIFIYLMRIVAGLKFLWHIDPVILHCQSLMRVV
jgi:hypothetical protein